MEIALIRHGKTKGNLEGRYVGRTDEPLLLEETERLRQSPYRTFTPDVVYTSGMLRCLQTAEVLFPACGRKSQCPFSDWRHAGKVPGILQEESFALEKLNGENEDRFVFGNDFSSLMENPVQLKSGKGIRLLVHPGLRETDFGAFEYKNYEELNENPAYQAWLDGGGLCAFPGGEPGTDFRARCKAAFLECIADAKKRNAGRVAFVVHGGTIMAVMEAFAVPKRDFYDWQVKNGEGFFVKLEECGEGRLFLSERKAKNTGVIFAR